jgi:uncharacterized membrane protein (DUF485 family)
LRTGAFCFGRLGGVENPIDTRLARRIVSGFIPATVVAQRHPTRRHLMAGIDFKAPVAKEREDASVVRHNTRMGVLLLSVYVVFYGGFMALSAFRPAAMAATPLGGPNLAVLYGFGLIVLALVLALVYMVVCRKSGHGSAA